MLQLLQPQFNSTQSKMLFENHWRGNSQCFIYLEINTIHHHTLYALSQVLINFKMIKFYSSILAIKSKVFSLVQMALKPIPPQKSIVPIEPQKSNNNFNSNYQCTLVHLHFLIVRFDKKLVLLVFNVSFELLHWTLILQWVNSNFVLHNSTFQKFHHHPPFNSSWFNTNLIYLLLSI